MASTLDFKREKHMDKSLLCFAVILSVGILAVLSSGFITVLQDYTMIIVAVTFLVAGIVSVVFTFLTAVFLRSASNHGKYKDERKENY